MRDQALGVDIQQLRGGLVLVPGVHIVIAVGVLDRQAVQVLAKPGCAPVCPGNLAEQDHLDAHGLHFARWLLSAHPRCPGAGRGRAMGCPGPARRRSSPPAGWPSPRAGRILRQSPAGH